MTSSGDLHSGHHHPASGAPAVEVSRAPTAADWCLEHALPESKCTKCDPDLVAHFEQARDFCAEHGFPESWCPVCHPQPPPPGVEQAAIEARVVRLRSPELERQAGLETARATQGRAGSVVECTARLTFDANRVAEVRALVPGIVRKLHVELGARVTRGSPMFGLESARVGEIQGALQSARQRVRTAEADFERKRELSSAGIASAREREVAEQALASARAEARAAEAMLRVAGAAGAAPTGSYTLSAPLAGTVVRRPAVLGLHATESESLATIADTSVLWALCDVPEADAASVAVGQRAVVAIDGSDGDPIAGKLTWIAAEVDARTRTVTARVEVPNDRGRLRANQFARARIETGVARTGVSVPRDGVQRVGAREVVFVRTAPGVYEPRVVQRHGHGDRVEVVGRVQAGDEVVTTGAILLRTELMPGSLGAACCEFELPEGE